MSWPAVAPGVVSKLGFIRVDCSMLNRACTSGEDAGSLRILLWQLALSSDLTPLCTVFFQPAVFAVSGVMLSSYGPRTPEAVPKFSFKTYQGHIVTWSCFLTGTDPANLKLTHELFMIGPETPCGDVRQPCLPRPLLRRAWRQMEALSIVASGTAGGMGAGAGLCAVPVSFGLPRVLAYPILHFAFFVMLLECYWMNMTGWPDCEV